MTDLRDRMAADETGTAMYDGFYGPPDTDGTAYPVALSGDPDMRLLQEVRLGMFEAQARIYLARLEDRIRLVISWVEEPVLAWPASLPARPTSGRSAAELLPFGARRRSPLAAWCRTAAAFGAAG